MRIDLGIVGETCRYLHDHPLIPLLILGATPLGILGMSYWKLGFPGLHHFWPPTYCPTPPRLTQSWAVVAVAFRQVPLGWGGRTLIFGLTTWSCWLMGTPMRMPSGRRGKPLSYGERKKDSGKVPEKARGAGRSPGSTTDVGANQQRKKTDCAWGGRYVWCEVKEGQEKPTQNQTRVTGGGWILRGRREPQAGFCPWWHFPGWWCFWQFHSTSSDSTSSETHTSQAKAIHCRPLLSI